MLMSGIKSQQSSIDIQKVKYLTSTQFAVAQDEEFGQPINLILTSNSYIENLHTRKFSDTYK